MAPVARTDAGVVPTPGRWTVSQTAELLDERRAGARVPLAAWRAARRAALLSPGYADHLAAHGTGGLLPRRWEELPYLDRHAVFAEDPARWVVGGLTSAAELACSSGMSGRPLALGVVSPAAAAAREASIDAALGALGARAGSPTLLVNLLPMGIAVPTSLATVACPSVHPEMALEVLTRYAAAFDRVVLVGEPLFLAAVAAQWAGEGDVHPVAWAFTGGEWVPEGLRRRIAGALGVPPARVVVSLGAAELGLHLLHETPALATARAALDAAPGLATQLGLAAADGPHAPSLLTWDAARVHVEQRRHPGGGTSLVMTALGEPALPLVRYDLGDDGRVLTAGQIAALAAATGVAPPPRVAAVSGRGRALTLRDGRLLRPEVVAEALHADGALSAALTGRFRLRGEHGAAACHLQAAPGRAPEDVAVAALCARLSGRAGAAVALHVHGHDAYPYHPAGDWTHKPRYLDPAR